MVVPLFFFYFIRSFFIKLPLLRENPLTIKKSRYSHYLFTIIGMTLCFIDSCLFIKTKAQWRSWLRHCATSRKVAGSISDGVTGMFQ
jgi:hypothetical protein